MKQQYYLHIPIDCADHILRKNRSSLHVLAAICLNYSFVTKTQCWQYMYVHNYIIFSVIVSNEAYDRIFCNENSRTRNINPREVATQKSYLL